MNVNQTGLLIYFNYTSQFLMCHSSLGILSFKWRDGGWKEHCSSSEMVPNHCSGDTSAPWAVLRGSSKMLELSAFMLKIKFASTCMVFPNHLTIWDQFHKAVSTNVGAWNTNCDAPNTKIGVPNTQNPSFNFIN